MIKYCLNINCRKRVWKAIDGEYCSEKCRNEDVDRRLEKEWISISLKKNVRERLAKIQDSIYKEIKKRVSYSELINLLIDLGEKADRSLDKLILKDLLK